jgi:SNF2 family DNA or RNA helicase
LVWRNTKESVTEEYQMVATKPEVVLLDFSPVEAAIYEEVAFVKQCYNSGGYSSYGSAYKFWRSDPVRELCCKLNYEWGNTLDEMREYMIKKKIKDIQDQKERIQQHKDTKLSYQNQINKPTRANDAWYLQSANRFIADYQKNLDALEKVLADHERLLQVFRDLKPQDKTKKLEYNTKDYWIENYGTKMASLVGYLQNLFKKEPTTRVIIFSQFTDYLDMIAALLEENNINSSMVEGNVYKKSKALKKFKAEDSDVQVILLSLSKAASGTNLIEASHVLLMDPMTGTKEEAQAYENQAIGRAQRQGQTKPVTVVRFVIKNTIEHEFYIRNTGTKQHGQVMLNRSNSKLVRSSSFGTLIANYNNQNNH